MTSERTVERLLRQQAALADFGSFAFRETDLQAVLMEAARICAQSLDAPFSKICRYRPEQNDLLVVAGYGWRSDVIGHVISRADETTTQGRAFVTGLPVILEDIGRNNSYDLPPFYEEYGIVSTVDVLVKGATGPFGVLEVDCVTQHTFDQNDINFLTGFANVMAEAVGTAERSADLRSNLAKMRKMTDEKEVLAAELQHRVRNNLQLIYGMLIRQSEFPEKDSRDGVRAIARRVMTLSMIYDHLLGHGLVQEIDFSAYLQSLCLSLENFQEQRPFEVRLVCDAEPMALKLDLVTALGIVVTEITTNAYLHAFPAGPGAIRVTLTQNDGKGVLIISDDGAGFVAQKESKRQGIGLIRRLLEQENGTADLTSREGTTWTLIFPTSDGAATEANAPILH